MKDTVYLVVSRKRVERMTKTPPDLYRHELAVRVRVTVPDEAFRDAIPTANLEVPVDSVLSPDFEAKVETVE